MFVSDLLSSSSVLRKKRRLPLKTSLATNLEDSRSSLTFLATKARTREEVVVDAVASNSEEALVVVLHVNRAVS